MAPRSPFGLDPVTRFVIKDTGPQHWTRDLRSAPSSRRSMHTTRALNTFALALVVVAVVAIVARNIDARAPVSLLDVSHDPTRELYAQLNPQFVARQTW
jgi:hypothetical protein